MDCGRRAEAGMRFGNWNPKHETLNPKPCGVCVILGGQMNSTEFLVQIPELEGLGFRV